MKRKFFSGLILSLACSASSIFAYESANHYVCSNDVYSVQFSTTGSLGKPSFNVMKKGMKVLSSLGDRIQMVNVPMGRLVSDASSRTIDGPSEYYSLVVPDVHVDEDSSTQFQTTLFRTVTRTSIGGPALVEGLLEQSQAITITCSASSIRF